MLKKLKNIITWIVFSPRCLLCKTESFEDNSLCAVCWSKLSFILGNICDRCGIPYFENSSCPCKKFKTYYSKIRAALVYDQHSDHLIYDFKYNDNLQAKFTISKLMLIAGEELIRNSDILMPVPLHKIRLRKRKFNQSLVLAKELDKNTKLKLIPDLVKRIKDTPSQSGLNQKLRRANMKSAFVINENYREAIRDKVIIVIDDVITTGSTINECAKVLKQNGAREVHALSFARTVKPSDL